MSELLVPAPVLEAFGVAGPARPLPGGQGTSVRAGDLVLKPGVDVGQTRWLAGLAQRVVTAGFRFPAPVPSVDGELVVDGWSAARFVTGARVPDQATGVGGWLQVLAAGRAFHRAVELEPLPAFLAARADRWAVADRMAWGELREPLAPRSAAIVDRLRPLLVSEGLRSQLVHGDLSGNVLLAPALEPAVIDLSPYWRPEEYGDAVVVVDALLWWRADPELVEVGRPCGLDRRRWCSLLARALVFRLLAFDESSRQESEEVERELGSYERVVAILEC